MLLFGGNKYFQFLIQLSLNLQVYTSKYARILRPPLLVTQRISQGHGVGGRICLEILIKSHQSTSPKEAFSVLTPVLSPQNSKNLSAELFQFERRYTLTDYVRKIRKKLWFLSVLYYVGADKQAQIINQ